MSTPTPPRSRAVLLGVQLPGVSDAEHESSLSELARLGKTLGLEVVGRVTQRRDRLAPAAVVGEGKLRELADWTGGTGVVPTGPPGSRRREEEVEETTLEAETPAPAEKPRASVVLVDHELSPSQAR